MIFSNIELISTNPIERDQIEVLMKSDLFIDASSGSVVEPKNTMIEFIPRQMEPDFAENFD